VKINIWIYLTTEENNRCLLPCLPPAALLSQSEINQIRAEESLHVQEKQWAGGQGLFTACIQQQWSETCEGFASTVPCSTSLSPLFHWVQRKLRWSMRYFSSANIRKANTPESIFTQFHENLPWFNFFFFPKCKIFLKIGDGLPKLWNILKLQRNARWCLLSHRYVHGSRHSLSNSLPWCFRFTQNWVAMS